MTQGVDDSSSGQTVAHAPTPALPASLLPQLQAAVDRSDHLEVDNKLGLVEQRASDDRALLARARAAASHSLYRRNRWLDAARLAAQAREAAEGAQDPLVQAEALVAWARIEWAGGQLDDALQHLAEAASKELPSQHRLQTHLNNLLGLVHADLGQQDVSEAFHRSALLSAGASGQPDLQMITLTNLAGRLLARGEALTPAATGQDMSGARANPVWQELDQLVAQAEALAQAHAQELALPHILVSQAASLLQRERLDQAQEVLQRLQQLVERFPDRSSLPHAALVLYQLHRRSGHAAPARAALQMGILEADQLKARARQAALHLAACELDESEGNYRAALDHHKRFHALREECAVESAQRKSIALNLRLQTQRVLREAAAERERARALAASNAALRRQADALDRAAHLDVLTGLPNRRVLDEQLPDMHRRARQLNQPLCLVLLDVDHFKLVNDRFSHAVGDQVLRTLGSLLGQHFRTGDLCGRYGGEEFVIALPGVDAQQGHSICERLRLRVQNHDWSRIDPRLKVTISLGMSEAQLLADAAQALQQADQRLYRAKDRGRNTTVGPDGLAADLPALG